MSERSVELPWAIRNAVAPVLDVGCAESSYLPQLPHPVDGIDIRGGRYGDLRKLYVGDIRTGEVPTEYATVLAISTVEHVGLECKEYGTVEDDADHGDTEAVAACHRAVAPGGKLLISVPFGASRDYGWFRQYDSQRLLALCGDLPFYSFVWVRTEHGDWAEGAPDGLEEYETLEYDFSAGSARAVALITIEKPR
jgi:SAM-dependent methyltransferase